eukprot:219931_1
MKTYIRDIAYLLTITCVCHCRVQRESLTVPAFLLPRHSCGYNADRQRIGVYILVTLMTKIRSCYTVIILLIIFERSLSRQTNEMKIYTKFDDVKESVNVYNLKDTFATLTNGYINNYYTGANFVPDIIRTIIADYTRDPPPYDSLKLKFWDLEDVFLQAILIEDIFAIVETLTISVGPEYSLILKNNILSTVLPSKDKVLQIAIDDIHVPERIISRSDSVNLKFELRFGCQHMSFMRQIKCLRLLRRLQTCLWFESDSSDDKSRKFCLRNYSSAVLPTKRTQKWAFVFEYVSK